MGFLKYATSDILEVKTSKVKQDFSSTQGFSKFAALESEEIGKDDGYVYVLTNAISSRVNKNKDGWPAEELVKAHRTFVGRPIFVDHNNDDPERARGVVLTAMLDVQDTEKVAAVDDYYATAPDNHKPPTTIKLIWEVDAKTYPGFAKAIKTGKIKSSSMGANIDKSICSICGNEAENPAQYCDHIKKKGATFEVVADTGEKVSKIAYEDCYGIVFFEDSGVFDPADPTADILEHMAFKTAAVEPLELEGIEKDLWRYIMSEFGEDDRAAEWADMYIRHYRRKYPNAEEEDRAIEEALRHREVISAEVGKLSKTALKYPNNQSSEDDEAMLALMHEMTQAQAEGDIARLKKLQVEFAKLMGGVNPYYTSIQDIVDELGELDEDEQREILASIRESMGDNLPAIPGDFESDLDRRLVDYTPSHNLHDPNNLTSLLELIPGARMVGYSETPFFSKLESLEGVGDPELVDPKVNDDLRTALFDRSPVESVPIEGMIFTQPNVDTGQIQKFLSDYQDRSDAGAFVVRYHGENYLMDGHHRTAVEYLSGHPTVKAHVLDLSDSRQAAIQFPPCPQCHKMAGFEPYLWARGFLQCKNCQHLVTPEDLANQLNDYKLHHDMDVWTLPETEHPLGPQTGAMLKGAPYPENSYENAPDHTPKGQKEWPEEVNAVYNACMREGNGSGDTKDEQESSCAAIAWAQHNKSKKKRKKSADESWFDEGEPREERGPYPRLRCPHCHSTNTFTLNGRKYYCRNEDYSFPAEEGIPLGNERMAMEDTYEKFVTPAPQDNSQQGYVPQYQMLRAPEKVDTLQNDQLCPNCKAGDIETDPDGIRRCHTCGYEPPAKGVDNPDLSQAEKFNDRQDASEGLLDSNDETSLEPIEPVSPVR